ncbi:cation/H(+) antiporter 15-like, partial [Asparagus officinalis]|uniref:cation/H(+) antiporter 15-like n=1 Tax=Asparagus officinalis TaxID=4686 RepID=UPI00098E78C4
ALSIGLGIGLHRLLSVDSGAFFFVIAIFLTLFNTATPVVIRALDELKLAMTDIGRLAISTALVTDLVCVVMLSVIDFNVWNTLSAVKNHIVSRFIVAALYLSVLATAIYLMRLGVNALNKRDMHRNEVEDDMVFYLLIILFLVTWFVRRTGLDPILGAFVLGMAMPREGPTARTMVHHLTFLVHSLILPVFFGLAGLQFDFGLLNHKEAVIMVALVVSLGMAGKIGGTMIGAKFLGIPVQDGLVLSLLLNVKGYIDLVVVQAGRKNQIFGDKTYMALLLSLFINNVIASPMNGRPSSVDRTAEKNGYEFNSIEDLDPEGELRMASCVHTPHDLRTVMDLIEIFPAPPAPPPHPVILTSGNSPTPPPPTTCSHQAKRKTVPMPMLYRSTLQSTPSSGDTSIHRPSGSSRFVPRQHAQGPGLRGTKCTRAIADTVALQAAFRWRVTALLSLSPESMMVHVVVVFLAGLTDREAAAYAARLARAFEREGDNGRFMATAQRRARIAARTRLRLDVEEGDDRDEVFIANFFNRFVVNGAVTYVERTVGTSSDFIKMLSSMEQIYSLYIVGRKVQGPAARLTAGMSSWEENPELGSVGDLLASSDFSLNGSVLVIQQFDFTTS